jgi:hypothetical protein
MTWPRENVAPPPCASAWQRAVPPSHFGGLVRPSFERSGRASAIQATCIPLWASSAEPTARSPLVTNVTRVASPIAARQGAALRAHHRRAAASGMPGRLPDNGGHDPGPACLPLPIGSLIADAGPTHSLGALPEGSGIVASHAEGDAFSVHSVRSPPCPQCGKGSLPARLCPLPHARAGRVGVCRRACSWRGVSPYV